MLVRKLAFILNSYSEFPFNLTAVNQIKDNHLATTCFIHSIQKLAAQEFY